MLSIERRVIRIHLIQEGWQPFFYKKKNTVCSGGGFTLNPLVLDYNLVHLIETETVHWKQMVVQELTTFMSEGGFSPFPP